MVEHVLRCQHHTFRTPAPPVQTILTPCGRMRRHEIQESAECQMLCLPFASGYTYAEIACPRFWKSLVEVESTNWGVVKLFNTQNKLMDIHQSDISKILLFSTSNLVSFIFIKSRHFTGAYLVLLHKTSHTSCILFFHWFPCAGSRESTPSVSSR